MKMQHLSTLFLLPVLCAFCAKRAAADCCAPVSAWLTRQLDKEGFHRDLITSVQLPWSPALTGCRLLLFERLPAGVYVDPYQLARLHGNRHRVLGPVDIEAMAHNADWLDVLSWVDLNVTEGEHPEQVTAELTFPVHGRYHRADETERVVSVYIESPRLFLSCDWENQATATPERGDEDYDVEDNRGAGCECAEREFLPCSAAGAAVCEYRPLVTDNSPTVVLSVPLGDLRDMELVLVGTTVAVTAGTVLLLLVISNRKIDPGKQQ